MTDSTGKESESFFGAAKMVTGLTLLSRVFGLLRSIAITSLGATRYNDAFQVAWSIPNYFRRLFGEGAMASAFVPAFTETMEKDGHEAANRLLSNAIGLLGAFLIVLLAVILGGLFVWGDVWPVKKDTRLLLAFTEIMLPFMVTICLLALASAALSCRGHFAYPAAAPVLQNFVVIAAAWFVAPRLRSDLAGQLYIVSAAVTVGGVVTLAGVLVFLRRHGFSIRPRLWPLEEGTRRILRTMGPMTAGLGLLQFNELFERLVAYILTATPDHPTLSIIGRTLHLPLTPGVIVRVDAARNMYQFPMGVLTMSLATVVFPLLSRYGQRGDMVNLRSSLNRALRLASMEGLAAAAGLFVLANPILHGLFQFRRFSSADADQAAFFLKMYAPGLWAFCTYQILARSFYAVKDNLTPIKVASWLVGFELVMFLTLVWVPGLGAGAFGVVSAVMFTVNSCILTAKLRKRVGPFGGRKYAISILRSLVACVPMAAVLYALKWALRGHSVYLIIGVCVPAGVAVFVAAAWLLRAPELGELFPSLQRRQKASTTGPGPT